MAYSLSNTKSLLILLILLLNNNQYLKAQESREIDCDYLHSVDSTLVNDWLLDFRNKPINVIEWGQLEHISIRDSMFKDKKQIKVRVEFVVDTLGQAKCEVIVRSDADEFNQAALEIITRSKFSPSMKKSQKVVSINQITVVFNRRNKYRNNFLFKDRTKKQL